MMKRPFTLIELLVVMAVIGILMGILLPAMSSVRTRGKELKAKTDITAIVTACKQYEADYGVLPDPQGASTGDWSYLPGTSNSSATCDQPIATLRTQATTTSTSQTYKRYGRFITLLTGFNYGATTIPGTTTHSRNIRNIKFLDTPPDYVAKGFVDPWGNTYGIGLDLNYNGQIHRTNSAAMNAPGTVAYNVTSTSTTYAGFHYAKGSPDTASGAILAPVAVFSMGCSFTVDATGKLDTFNTKRMLTSWR